MTILRGIIDLIRDQRGFLQGLTSRLGPISEALTRLPKTGERSLGGSPPGTPTPQLTPEQPQPNTERFTTPEGVLQFVEESVKLLQSTHEAFQKTGDGRTVNAGFEQWMRSLGPLANSGGFMKALTQLMGERMQTEVQKIQTQGPKPAPTAEDLAAQAGHTEPDLASMAMGFLK